MPLPTGKFWQSLSLFAIGLCACTAPDQPADATVFPVEARVVPLIDTDPGARRLGPLEYVGGLHLTAPVAAFGGFSGLSVRPDGKSLVAVTDKGRWFRADIRRNENGIMTGLDNAEMRPLNDTDGAPIRIGTRWRDSESIESLDHRHYVVSLEGRHRLYLYKPTPEQPDPLRSTPIRLPTPGKLDNAPLNSGLEAIALLDDRHYLLVTEGYFTPDRMLHAWITGPESRVDLKYRATGGFRPTDLARLSPDRLLVIERRFSFIGGLTNRLALIDLSQARKSGIIETTEIAEFEPPYLTDNFEGLSAVPRPGGGYDVYIISDDNFNFLQRTLLLQFYWPDNP